MKQEAGITLHGAADVGDDNEGPRFQFWFTIGPVKNLTFGSQPSPQSAAHIDEMMTLARTMSTRFSLADLPEELGHHSLYCFGFLTRHFGKVFIAQQLSITIGTGYFYDRHFLA